MKNSLKQSTVRIALKDEIKKTPLLILQNMHFDHWAAPLRNSKQYNITTYPWRLYVDGPATSKTNCFNVWRYCVHVTSTVVVYMQQTSRSLISVVGQQLCLVSSDR